MTATYDNNAAYNAFVRYGKSSSWCKSHALSFRALSRAVSIRSQVQKYMQRFGIPVESCEGDAKRLRKCLVTGYWRNIAKWVPDGTYRSLQGNKVYNIFCIEEAVYWSIYAGFLCPSNIHHVYPKTSHRLGDLPRCRRNQESTVRQINVKYNFCLHQWQNKHHHRNWARLVCDKNCIGLIYLFNLQGYLNLGMLQWNSCENTSAYSVFVTLCNGSPVPCVGLLVVSYHGSMYILLT